MFRYLCHCLFVLVPGMTAGAVAAGDVLLEVPDLKWVLVTQAEGSTVQVLDLSRGVTPLATLRTEGRGRVLAVHLQREGRRVWVLGDRGLDVHDAYSGRLVERWHVPEGVRPEGLQATTGGRPLVRSGNRRYEALLGAAFLVPAATRVSMR
ncbi:hypothetical protein [Zoogloea sp.]|uniref:YncE family protein n=1 Tax=Zoogloea sp. TaxID=49181 RepID=UPI001B4E28E2|nr:hypothetical protein [Zoogloea sp.]MBK6656169.1 hypothetical protein [Zoogloea sp.]MBP7444841.1 hypothetical protein [Zoogloea sp.]